MNYIKFNGRFKDLIPNKYKFCRLYASNYNVYRFQPTDYGRSIWIWVKGRELSFDSYFEFSGSILEYYINNGFKHSECLLWYNNEIIEYNKDKHDFSTLCDELLKKNSNGELTKELKESFINRKKEILEINDNSIKIDWITKELLEELKRLYESKMIEVAE